jgi:hypothetical protein
VTDIQPTLFILKLEELKIYYQEIVLLEVVSLNFQYLESRHIKLPVKSTLLFTSLKDFSRL